MNYLYNNLQEMIDDVVPKTYQQGNRCMTFVENEDGSTDYYCRYKHDDKHCVIGHSLYRIEDKSLRNNMYDYTGGVYVISDMMVDKLYEFYPDSNLDIERKKLKELQQCHDYANKEYWICAKNSSDNEFRTIFKDKITNFCKRYNLKNPLENVD